MDRTTLRQALVAILEEQTGENHDHFGDDVNLRNGLGIDSVDLVMLVLAVQNRFHVEIDSTELEKVTRVGDLLDLLQTRLATKAAA